MSQEGRTACERLGVQKETLGLENHGIIRNVTGQGDSKILESYTLTDTRWGSGSIGQKLGNLITPDGTCVLSYIPS